MANEDTTAVEFYAPWPNLGKKFSQQLGEIRTDTSHLAPLVRGMGLDAAGDFTTLDGVEAAVVQSREWGKQGFHNKFRWHYNKTSDTFDVAYNTGTEAVPNWYTTWTIGSDGNVSQQNTPTTASNLGTGTVNSADFFKQKTGVDLEFKTLQVFYPLSVSTTGTLVKLNTGGEANTYSSTVASSSSGGTGGIESILADTGKTGVDLPFKAFEAGANAVITDTGDTIRFESTAQVVEFYGIVVAHSDNSVSIPSVHVFKVNVDEFYITQDTTAPSAHTTILNLRDTTTGNYVQKGGDNMTGQLQMYDGSAAEPAIGFVNDLDTGMRLRATDDLALTVGGTDRVRVQDDLLLTAVPIQITNTGTASAPDYSFFPDIDTGIYQIAADDNSIAFATGGSRAGWFDSNQDFHVQNDLHAGRIITQQSLFYGAATADSFVARELGSTSPPAYSWTNDNHAFGTVSGMYLSEADTNPASLRFSYGGSTKLYVEADRIAAREPFMALSGESSAVGAPPFSFEDSTSTGVYEYATNQLGFTTAGVHAGHFDASQNLYVIGSVYVPAGSVGAPSISFTGKTDTGIYLATGDNVDITVDGSSIANFQPAQIWLKQPIYHVSGAEGTPSYTFRDDSNTGMWADDLDTLRFSTGAAEAGFFDASQNLTVTNRIYMGAGTEGAPALSFTGKTDTGIYLATGDNVDISVDGASIANFQPAKIWLKQPIHQVSGSVGAPTYAFREDTDTGLWTDDLGTIRFSTGGTEAGYFDSKQNLFVTNTLSADKGNFNTSMNAPTGTFYTQVTVGNNAPGDSIIEYYDEGTLRYTTGYDDSAAEYIITSGAMDGTNDEIRVQTDNVIIPNLEITDTLSASRVYAGIGTFYMRAEANAFLIRENNFSNQDNVDFGWIDDGNDSQTSYTGFHRSSADTIRMAVQALDEFEWNTTEFKTIGGIQIQGGTGNATGPQLCPASADNNTGIFQETADTLHFATGGVNRGNFDASGLTVPLDVQSGRVEAGYGNFYIEAYSGQFVAPQKSNALSNAQYAFDGFPGYGLAKTSANGVYITVSNGFKQYWTTTSTQLAVPLRLDDDATAATPALQFRDDTNTGIYQRVNAGDDLAFSTGGAYAGHFDSTQNFEVVNTITSDRMLAEYGTFYAGLEAPRGWNQFQWTVTADETSLNWANKPAALTEFRGVDRNRTLLDLVHYSQWRLVMDIAGSGGISGSLNGVQFSPDLGSNWYGLDNGTINVISDATVTDDINAFVYTAWSPIHANARINDCLMRMVGEGGDGVGDPAYGTIQVQFRG